MTKKLTLKYIKEYINNFGYELLTDRYINNSTKLQIKCNRGHLYNTIWSSFQQGKRCPECAINKKSLSYKYVKDYIEKENYILLSKNYINSQSKLQIKCPYGHQYYSTFNNFKQGRRCPECGGTKKLTYEYVNEFIENEGYKLLSKEYINIHSKLKLNCEKGHCYESSFENFQRGSRCPECYGNKKLTNKKIIEILKLYDNIRENDNKEIEIACKYCGKYHIPERNQLTYRIQYINGKHPFESLMYCSYNCKKECPIYRQNKYPKGHKPATSREVQPQLRKMVFEKDKYNCQKCGKHQDELETGLHCHHIDAVVNNPIESADINNCITLCKSCHKKAHKLPGCGTYELRCIEKERI